MNMDIKKIDGKIGERKEDEKKIEEKKIEEKEINEKIVEKRIGEMIYLAIGQLEYSYAPYSCFRVGAALLSKSGKIYTGCNIENAAYTPSNCAERTAFFKAVSEGERGFLAICIVGGKAGKQPLSALTVAPEGADKGHKDGIGMEYTAPCGVCRQVMMEFCNPETFQIILAISKEEYKIFTLKELLPIGFGPENLA